MFRVSAQNVYIRDGPATPGGADGETRRVGGCGPENPRTHEPPTYYYYLTLCVRLGPPWGRCMHDMHTKGMVVGNSEASPTRPLSGGALTL